MFLGLDLETLSDEVFKLAFAGEGLPPQYVEDLEDYESELDNLNSMYSSVKSRHKRLERDLEKLKRISPDKFLKNYKSESEYKYDQESLLKSISQMAAYVKELLADLQSLKSSKPLLKDYV